MENGTSDFKSCTLLKTYFHFLNVFLNVLTLSQTTDFRLFQTEQFVDDNYKFEKHDRKFLGQVENTVGTGEIARYEQFLLFPQCFQKTCTADT